MNGNDLKIFRTKNKYTQKQLSDILGYRDVTALQKIESGQTKMPILVERVIRLIERNPNKIKKYFEGFLK